MPEHPEMVNEGGWFHPPEPSSGFNTKASPLETFTMFKSKRQHFQLFLHLGLAVVLSSSPTKLNPCFLFKQERDLHSGWFARKGGNSPAPPPQRIRQRSNNSYSAWSNPWS